MRSRILKIIKESVSSKVWNTWFGSFSVLKIEDKTVVFQVTNPFSKDWIERKYGKVILKAIRDVLGPEAQFKILSINPKEEPPSSNTGPLVRRKPVVLSELNTRLTFDTFVVGESNRFAYSAAVEVASEPGRFNPFFMYGGVGLGKTHLAQAIAHETLRRWPELRVIYTTSEEFMNQMIESIKSGQLQTFREKYRRKVDVLIIDDVQFLIDKQGIQTELFHTFNYLHDQGKQLVFCSDRNPTKLTGFHERLISRFKMGLVIEIGAPDFETRLEVTRRFAEQEGVKLSGHQLKRIASSPSFNFRHVKGLITKMAFRIKVTGDHADLDSIIDEFLDIPVEIPKDALLQEIVSAVADVLKVPESELLGATRNLSKYRAATCYALVRVGSYSLKEVASKFGRSKSTVSYLVKRGKEYVRTDARAKAVIELVASMLNPQAGSQFSSTG